MNQVRFCATLNAITLLFVLACMALPVSADWKGRFDLGGTPVFYDDPALENRTPLTSGLRLQYAPEESDKWLFKANVKLRSEANSPDGNLLRIRDLFVQYGPDASSSRIGATAGIFSPNGIAGAGDVMGAGLQISTKTDRSTRMGFGIYGGANSVVRESTTVTDGVRYGAYVTATGSNWGRISIVYVSTSNTDRNADEVDSITFSSAIRISDRFDVSQTGEFVLTSGNSDDNKVTSWVADAGVDISESIRLSVSYDYFDLLPYLEVLPENGDPASTPGEFGYTSTFSGSSIGPRLDVRIGHSWRLFGRYRYRQTDDFLAQTWHQYLTGFGYVNPSGSGVTVDGSFFVNRGETRHYETGFLRIGRDFGPGLNLSLNFASDRFARLETVSSAPHVDSTWRAGMSGFYRISSDMTAILTYERTFADDDRNSDHRLMFNWQYRF